MAGDAMGSSTTPPWLTLYVYGKSCTSKRDAGRVRRGGCRQTATTMTKTLNGVGPSCCQASTRRRCNVNVQCTDVVVIGICFHCYSTSIIITIIITITIVGAKLAAYLGFQLRGGGSDVNFPEFSDDFLKRHHCLRPKLR